MWITLILLQIQTKNSHHFVVHDCKYKYKCQIKVNRLKIFLKHHVNKHQDKESYKYACSTIFINRVHRF